MKSRILFILLGIALYFCSAPFAFADEAMAEDVRTEIFVAGEVGDLDDRQAAVSFSDAALVQFAECGTDGESSVDGEEETRRENRRTLSHKIYFSKCRVLSCLSKKNLSKGVAKHPAIQDAQQERTAAVRFLQLAALVC